MPQISERRNQILLTSARLFAEYGFEATTMRQIAEEVNLIAGSIYHHFPTKEDILHEIIGAPTIDSANAIEYIYKMPVDAELRLITSILRRFEDYIYRWEPHAVVQQNSQFLRRNDNFSYVTATKMQSSRYHQSILTEGMEAGLFHEGIDAYLMVGTISRILSSGAAWFRQGDIYSSDKPSHYVIDNVIDFHLDSILRMVRSRERLDCPIPREFCERLLGSISAEPSLLAPKAAVGKIF